MEFLDKLLDFGEEVSNSMPLSDRIIMGLQTTLLGMGVIFAVLIILWAVLSVFKLVFYKGGTDKTDDTPTLTAEPAPTPVGTSPATMQDDAELIAAITAAIAVVMDAPETSFRVVSFRRTARK